MSRASQSAPAALSVIGVDIGKDVFHIVGFDDAGHIVIRRKIKRLAFVATFGATRGGPCHRVNDQIDHQREGQNACTISRKLDFKLSTDRRQCDCIGQGANQLKRLRRHGHGFPRHQPAHDQSGPGPYKRDQGHRHRRRVRQALIRPGEARGARALGDASVKPARVNITPTRTAAVLPVLRQAHGRHRDPRAKGRDF
jgi:hypothetical protein